MEQFQDEYFIVDRQSQMVPFWFWWLFPSPWQPGPWHPIPSQPPRPPRPPVPSWPHGPSGPRPPRW